MGVPTVEPEDERTLAYYEAVPYLLVLESVEKNGEWLRRATYPELPGCAAEASAALEAIEKLEDERRRSCVTGGRLARRFPCRARRCAASDLHGPSRYTASAADLS